MTTPTTPENLPTFEQHFGRAPQVTASAPGRVNLLGEHTDYQGGFVLPTAIPQVTTVALGPNGTREHRVFAADLNEQSTFPVGGNAQDGFARYVAGALALGGAPDGLDVHVTSNVPMGAGLSSSAALEVAVLRGLRDLGILDASDERIALIAQRVEHEFVGVQCGIMDQMASSVANSATMLLLDTRSLERHLLFLPVLVLPLNDRERQPRLEVGRDAVDGYTVEADLPFSVGSSTLGTTLLRYYQNRDPSVGMGVSLRSFAPLPLVDRLNLYALANPRPVGSGGYDLDLDFSVRGRLPLVTALRDLDYTLSVTRSDVGRTDSDPQRGVTNVAFGAKADYPLFTADFNYINRFGPEPTTALTTPLKLPEVTVDPKVYTSGNLSADFRVTAGRYTAASNPLSRSASAQGANITTERLEEQHNLSYTASPWQNADLSLKNTFTGRYYGTGARTVQLTLGATLTQRFNTTNTLSVSGAYNRTEGTSPFAFDALGGRLLSAPLGVTLSAVPARDVTFGASYSRDLFLSPDQQGPLNFTLRVNRRPLTLDASSSVNLYTQALESASFTATLSDPDAGQITPATPGTPARPAGPTWPAPNLALSASGSYARLTGPGPLTLRATVTGDVRTNTFSAYLIHNVRTPDVNEIGVSYTLNRTRDTVLNALTLSGSQRLLPRTADQSGAAQLIGETSLTWRGAYRLSSAHSLLLNRPATAQDSGTLSFSVGTVQGSATNWNVTYGGAYDLVRGGFTRPALSGSLTATRPGQRLALGAALNTPGLDQPRTELSRASLDASWLFGTRAALAGRAAY
ncbi:galactokinase family protein, partial [Deinococcus sp. 6GRE01]|uniref:galactokinase n=1 Tax=Deinococcus sp. 6GRE01 TaxID=2745873 RepID=UPI001E62710B|nr:hypothetical protein [Deinococcus sp. 6GRE01]